MKRSQIVKAFQVVVCISMFSSCVSKKDISYFQYTQESKEAMSLANDNIDIKPDDLLTIRVSAAEQEAAMPFNLTKTVGAQTGAGVANVELETYMVSNEGTIDFPVLGEIKVAGFTSSGLAAKLKKDLNEYVKDPIVNVRIENFQISVLGEVKSPGTFSIKDDHINLSKALGLAGDLLITGERNNILVMRENEEGKIVHKYLDLTDPEIVTSEYYNLKQNDVVYVEPTGPKRQSGSYLGTASTALSIVSVIVSLVILLTN